MKINRQKKANKYLNFYSNNFGFRKPFQVLIDGTFCYAALQNKVNIQDQLSNYLGAEIKLLTTKCVIIETEKLGKALYGTSLIVKQFSVHQCNHKKAVSGSACFTSMIGENNPNRYIIATQDRELQDVVRGVPGTPVLYLHQKAPTLEEPSRLSLKIAQEKATQRFSVTDIDHENIKKMKEVVFGPQEEKTKKKKKKGGPNPLSCKKKKKASPYQHSTTGNGKRKRHRIRIPKHVKELLQSHSG
ncbi:hypothetical protein LSTR_LSTR002745 [Laodelphax striatellus]|uniref:rRNA-processing protein UTP23 homolog n=1 Tax=Laodelphax striatellus TaxID=195883 RepID=A0A482X5V9_LAOST|nr:hypothetical protein LSTR_LSTR002745 [Laodelphax striatellus]